MVWRGAFHAFHVHAGGGGMESLSRSASRLDSLGSGQLHGQQLAQPRTDVLSGLVILENGSAGSRSGSFRPGRAQGIEDLVGVRRPRSGPRRYGGPIAGNNPRSPARPVGAPLRSGASNPVGHTAGPAGPYAPRLVHVAMPNAPGLGAVRRPYSPSQRNQGVSRPPISPTDRRTPQHRQGVSRGGPCHAEQRGHLETAIWIADSRPAGTD